MQIGNKEPVPGSFLTKIGFILVSGFAYRCISSALRALDVTKELMLFACILKNSFWVCQFHQHFKEHLLI